MPLETRLSPSKKRLLYQTPDENLEIIDNLTRSPFIEMVDPIKTYQTTRQEITCQINNYYNNLHFEVRNDFSSNDTKLLSFDKNSNAQNPDSELVSPELSEKPTLSGEPTSSASFNAKNVNLPVNIDPTSEVKSSKPSVCNSSPRNSNSLICTTTVRTISPVGNIIESEVTRNYTIPLESVTGVHDEIFSQTGEQGICLDQMTSKIAPNSDNPSINVTTTLRVSRSPDGEIKHSETSGHNTEDINNTPCLIKSSSNHDKYSVPVDTNQSLISVKNNLDKPEATTHKLTENLQNDPNLSKEQTEQKQLEQPLLYEQQIQQIQPHQQSQQVESCCSGQTALLDFQEIQPLEKIYKITNTAREDINIFYTIMESVCSDLQQILNGILKRDFQPCEQFIKRLSKIPTLLESLIPKLEYSPFENELIHAQHGLERLLNDVAKQPALIILHLIEVGYYIYEVGTLLGEKFLPQCFAPLVHAIHSRVQRLSLGRVVRQIIYVPHSFDPIVSTYYKDRRLERIENFCACQVRLLNPTHPRAAYCPPDCRTLEVNFDPIRGKYIGFLDLLNRCLHPKRCAARIGTTIMRRANGTEIEVQAYELNRIQYREPRPRLLEVRSDVCTGPTEMSNALAKAFEV